MISWRGDALVAEVGGGGMAELVEVPAGVSAEQDAGAVVAEAGAAGGGAQVRSGGAAGRARLALGQEHRSGLPAAQQAGQQAGGAGAPVDPFGVAAFGADRGAAGVQVEVFDVEGQDFAGPGGRLVEQPPEGFLPQWHVAAGQRAFDRRAGHRPGGVGRFAAPFAAGG
jgi:hypothetical protein